MREEKVAKDVMVPLKVSHDGTVHWDSVSGWKDFAPDIKVHWVGIAQNVLRYNVVVVGRFFNKGSWVSDAWRKAHLQEFEEESERAPGIIPTAEQRREEIHLDAEIVGVVCVCGPRARHLHAALG